MRVRANGRGWLAIAAATLLGGCFPYTPAELRPPADTPAPPAVVPIARQQLRAPATIPIARDATRMPG